MLHLYQYLDLQASKVKAAKRNIHRKPQPRPRYENIVEKGFSNSLMNPPWRVPGGAAGAIIRRKKKPTITTPTTGERICGAV